MYSRPLLLQLAVAPLDDLNVTPPVSDVRYRVSWPCFVHTFMPQRASLALPLPAQNLACRFTVLFLPRSSGEVANWTAKSMLLVTPSLAAPALLMILPVRLNLLAIPACSLIAGLPSLPGPPRSPLSLVAGSPGRLVGLRSPSAVLLIVWCHDTTLIVAMSPPVGVMGTIAWLPLAPRRRGSRFLGNYFAEEFTAIPLFAGGLALSVSLGWILGRPRTSRIVDLASSRI